MTVDDLIKHYKTQAKVAKRLGVSQSAVSNWKKRGKVPPGQQARAQIISRGRLKADASPSS